MFSSLTHHSLSLYSPPIPKQVLLIDHQEAAVLESDRTHMTRLGSILTRNAEQEPDRVGIIDGDRSFSWSEIQDRANRLANALVERGVWKGDRVAFLLRNGHPWVEVTFAVLKIGTVLVLMDFHPAEVMNVIEREKPDLMACATVTLRMLPDFPDARNRDTTSLKRVYYGGSSMGSREAFDRIREVFPCHFQQGYGNAETCILVTRLDPEDHAEQDVPGRPSHLSAAGRPVAGAEVKVLGPEGDLKDSCSKQAREHDGLTNRRQSELPASQQDPLRHCRRCEFQEICQKFCTQYFE
jgi:acyl-CoA synthetase (AMP-forming)/AMP-acid ligase II